MILTYHSQSYVSTLDMYVRTDSPEDNALFTGQYDG